MAKDLMRMLTEITPTQQPVAVPGTPGFRGMFGQQQAQRLQGSLGSLARGGAPSAQARMGQALAGLDLNKPEDLAKLAKIQQGTGDLAGAAQTAAKIKTLRTQEAQAGAEKTQREQLASYLDATYPELDLGKLASAGTITPKNLKDFISTPDDQYKIVGNNVLDITTGKYLPPPPGTKKGGYTVSKIYDPERGANVVQFLDIDDPTKVLKEVLDTKDVGRQSASLLKLQSENLKEANNAAREAREANAVALRLEKAAKQGMTGGIIATGEEFIKSILGSEDEVTLLRKAADRLRVSRGIANLPVGPASDKDVALVMAGELPSTANPATVAAYVRGIAKLAKAERDFYSNQNAWLDRYKDNSGFSSYMAKEQLEKQLGHSAIVAAEKKLAAVNYDPAALAIFEQKFGFDYMAAKEELDRANKTLEALKREDF